MRRVVVVSSACGLLAINVAALLWLVGPLSSGSSSAAEVSADPVATQPAAQTVTPVGERPPGVRDMEAALAGVGATPEVGSWPSWCGTPPETPWKAFGVTEDGTHVGILLASAGDGARLWQQQQLALTGCSQFRVVGSTPTSLTLRRTDVPVTWVVARHEDVLVSVLQVSDKASTQALEAIATQVLSSTATQCLSNPDDDTGRNPWRPGYVPWHPAVPIDTPDPGGPVVPQVTATVEWAPVEASPRPELAPVSKPDVTFNPYTTDVELAPLRKVPVLVDPAELVPPAVARPAAPPPAAVPMPTVATGYFAREDTIGPGCGWTFAGTVPPTFDPALPGAELESRIDAAFTTAATDLASWLVWSVDARVHADEDAQTRAALAAWAAYDDALKKASAAWQTALDRRQISLDTWFAYVPVDPLIPPTALPSAEPTDAPTAAPTSSPATSPTATGVR